MPDKPDALVPVPSDMGGLSKLAPEVRTLARPTHDWLLQARADVQRCSKLPDHVITKMFQTYREEGHTAEWLADSLAPVLAGMWAEGGDPRIEEAKEAALYLADEYEQVGDGIHIVSTDTGKIIAVLGKDDIYQPADVPRESGSMATPLPRIRPELEGFITRWVFDRDREAGVRTLLAGRAHQTDLLREEGDPRLLMATRGGREQIVAGLREENPKALLTRSGGTVGALLTHFTVRESDDGSTEGLEPLMQCVAIARTRMGIQDQTTTNLSYNRPAALRGLFGQGWGREIGRQIADAAKKRISTVPMSTLPEKLEELADLWIADPNLVSMFMRKGATVLPVEGVVGAVGIRGSAGVLVVRSESYECGGAEIFDRWEVAGSLEYQIYLDWEAVCRIEVSGVEHQAQIL